MGKKTVKLLSKNQETMQQILEQFRINNYFSMSAFSNLVALEELILAPVDVLIIDEENQFDLMATDLCKIIRSKNEEVIIVIISKQYDVSTKILALELGADDYLMQPINRLELVARIKAIYRRMDVASKLAEDEFTFEFNDLYLDSKRYICTVNDDEMRLTKYEFLTLLYLVKNSRKSVDRNDLLAQVWGLPDFDLGSTRPVDGIVRRLRKKLKEQHSTSQIISHWGFGYRLDT